MKNRIPQSVLIAFFAMFFSVTLWSQDTITPVNQLDSMTSEIDSLQKLAFEATKISEAISASNALINGSLMKHRTRETYSRHIQDVDSLFSTIQQFMADTMVISMNGISLRELDVLTQQIEFYKRELKRMQKRLDDETESLYKSTQSLTATKQDWIGILEAGESQEILQDRMELIQKTSLRLDSVNHLLQQDLVSLVDLEDRLANKIIAIEQLEAWVMEQRLLAGERFFSREMPGLFDDEAGESNTALIEKHKAQIRKSFRTDMDIMKTTYSTHMGVAGILLVLLLIYAFWFKKNHQNIISQQFKLSEKQMLLIQSPLVTMLFVIGLLIRLVLPHLPHTYGSLNLVVMMIPMLILIIRFFGSRIRNWVLLLSILCGLTFFYELTYNPDILLRGILMGFSVSALTLFLWYYIKRPLLNKVPDSFITKLLRAILLLFIVLLSIGMVANLAGAFTLAEFLTIIPIQIVLLAFGVLVATSIVDTLIFLLMASNFMQKLNLLKDDFKYIYRKTTALANLLLWGLFFVITLNIFRIKDPLFQWFHRLFTNGIKVGDAEITLGSILIFILVIWASIWITRILSRVLEKEVFPRVETAKGFPTTITLILRISLISSGFFLAAAAAGIKLSNLSIILGAFSVGIGFGLQNIFNNMVSGIILALERPIKVGDVVQVGELIGSVTSIGLRSSNVKSFYGAEVIVPNGNLISNEMINWTLSDSFRRMDLRIGVAYGSDSDKVKGILEQVAHTHALVAKIPPPKAYFTGFGDSALDFRLLAWTHIDQRLEVESDLNGAIDKALSEAGIEIPFPQRDLHIRSNIS